MGLFSKLLTPSATSEKSAVSHQVASSDDDELILGAIGAQPKAPAEKRGMEKRRHPRVVQTTTGGVYGQPRYWVYGDRECYEDPNDDGATLSLAEASEKAALSRPDLEGKVELPRYLKKRGLAGA